MSASQKVRTAPRPNKKKPEPLPFLMLLCLGVVFGDIGTSPLYSLQVVFNSPIARVDLTENNILGVVSLTIWTLIVIPCLGYLVLMMKADNDGEGGVMSLASLIEKHHGKKILAVTCLAAAGAALFFADSLITPAVSILGAIDGVNVMDSIPNQIMIPAALVLVVILFSIQKYGTHTIGKVFGPLMACWFLVMAIGGLANIFRSPEILLALSPSYAVLFALRTPHLAIAALGGIVLTVTGVEALYADMGHFGRRPIVLAWAILVMPALCLNYMGQGALLLADPSTSKNPFYLLFPENMRIVVLLLAVLATFIASQSVITGVFSISRQASRLSLLPRLKVISTSTQEMGQIYLPSVNAMLFSGVVLLILIFQSPHRLASAYGFAVTLTLLIELSLLTVMMLTVWKWPLRRVIPIIVILGGWELALFISTVPKIVHGAWLPALIALVVLFIMATWNKGSRVMLKVRTEMEGNLNDYLDSLRAAEDILRTPGTSVFLQGSQTTVPLAMKSLVDFERTLQDIVILIHVHSVPVPHVKQREKIFVNKIHEDLKIYVVTYNVGFNDSQAIKPAIKAIRSKVPSLEFTANEVVYILSTLRIEPGNNPEMPKWCFLFRSLEKFSANRTRIFCLPLKRTMVIGKQAAF